MIKSWTKFYESADNQEITKDMISFIFKLYQNCVPGNRIGVLMHTFFSNSGFRAAGCGGDEDMADWYYESLHDGAGAMSWGKDKIFLPKGTERRAFLKLYHDVMAIWGDLPLFEDILDRATNLIDENWDCYFEVDQEENLLIEFKKEINFENFILFPKKLAILAQKLKSMTKRDVYVYKAEFHIHHETEGTILIEGT